MVKVLKHQWLITAGCLLWCASFFSEVKKLQPYSTVGLAIAPILMISGISFWAQHYYRTSKHSPQVGKLIGALVGDIAKNPFSGIGFLFRHALHFWTLCILLWMGISFLGFGLFINSDAFSATQKYCETNDTVLAKTGKITYYSPLISGNISTHENAGNARFHFIIVGTKGNFDAESRLVKQNGNWILQALRVEQ